jgi:hypothetical protein
MPIQPRRILNWQVHDIVDVAWTASGSRMTLSFQATDQTPIVLTIPPELAETLRADLARTLREPPGRGPAPKT